MELLKDDPVADDMLDVVRHHGDDRCGIVFPVVGMTKRAERLGGFRQCRCLGHEQLAPIRKKTEPRFTKNSHRFSVSCDVASGSFSPWKGLEELKAAYAFGLSSCLSRELQP